MKKKIVTTFMAAICAATIFGTTGLTAFAAEAPATETFTKQALNAEVVTKVFDAKYYAETYPDVVSVLGDDAAVLLNHYMTYGVYEGRDASETFNATIYSFANTDLKAVYGDNIEAIIEHYIEFGIKENRIATTAGLANADETTRQAVSEVLSNSSTGAAVSSDGQKAYINLSTGEVTTTPSFGCMDMDTFRSDITYDNNRGVLLNYNDDGSAQYIKFGETVKMNDGTVARLSGDANNYSINTYDVVTEEQQQSWIDSGIAVVTHMDGTVEGSFENSPAQGVDESNCVYYDYNYLNYDIEY